MKKNKSLIATLLVFSLLLLASIGGMSVFAEEGDVSAISEESAVTEVEETAATVSGCDLKKDDLAQVKVKQYGFSMLVPKDNVTSIESDASVFTAMEYSRPYFMEQGCIMQAFTNNENYCAVSLFVSELSSLFDYYGDYSTLSKAQQDELVADAISDGNDKAEFVKINGRTYLQASVTDSTDESSVYTQYQFTTVIDGQEYMLYIQAINATDADKAVINEMIKSIKLDGMGIQLSIVEIVLIVVCIALVLAVAIAYFFLFRVNEFAKAGIKDYALIGFDLPEREEDDDFDDDDDDVFDDDEDDDFDDDEDDDFDDDEDEVDTDEEVVEETEDDEDSEDNDSDDERIIKD